MPQSWGSMCSDILEQQVEIARFFSDARQQVDIAVLARHALTGHAGKSLQAPALTPMV